MKHEFVVHPFKPIYNSNSKILILGSMPSPKSREVGFYYSHKQNRFWKVLSAIFNEEILNTAQAKTTFLLNHKIALWDVVKSCNISGANDSSINNIVLNDFSIITQTANISAIFTVGKTATKIFNKYSGLTSIALPSTSSANCATPFNELCEKFKQILPYLN